MITWGITLLFIVTDQMRKHCHLFTVIDQKVNICMDITIYGRNNLGYNVTVHICTMIMSYI